MRQIIGTTKIKLGVSKDFPCLRGWGGGWGVDRGAGNQYENFRMVL